MLLPHGMNWVKKMVLLIIVVLNYQCVCFVPQGFSFAYIFIVTYFCSFLDSKDQSSKLVVYESAYS